MTEAGQHVSTADYQQMFRSSHYTYQLVTLLSGHQAETETRRADIADTESRGL